MGELTLFNLREEKSERVQSLGTEKATENRCVLHCHDTQNKKGCKFKT